MESSKYDVESLISSVDICETLAITNEHSNLIENELIDNPSFLFLLTTFLLYNLYHASNSSF